MGNSTDHDALDAIRLRPLPSEWRTVFVDYCEPDVKAAYVSTPMTSGRRLMDQISDKKRDLSKEERRAVMVSNRRYAESLAERVSEISSRVINPYSLDDMRGWEQPDYHRFWIEVIDQCVASCYFVKDWEYSTGCVIEYAEALRQGVSIFDHTLKPVSLERGCAMLRRSIVELERRGLNSEIHVAVLNYATSKLLMGSSHH